MSNRSCLSIIAAILLLTTHFYFATWYLSDGFALSKIKSPPHFCSKWEVAGPPIKEIKQLLDQDFHYIGTGSQCYAFESADGQIVLKFFRQNRYCPPKIAPYITGPLFLKTIFQKKKEAKLQKQDALYQSCLIAYKELREETGLLYLHLNPTKNIKKKVVVFDKLKRSYALNIDDYAFMIQKKGVHIFPYLTTLLESGKKEQAKSALGDLVVILNRRLSKGINDPDSVIHKNSGFIDNRALFFDVGEFSKEKCADLQQELNQTTKYLRKWLEQKDPELAAFLDKLISNTA